MRRRACARRRALASLSQVHLYNGTGKAIVAHNIMAGSLGITNDVGNASVVVGDNVADKP